MVGLSDAWSGVIQDTASTSTLVALLCARERTTRFALARGGLQGEEQAARRLHVEPQPTARSRRRRCSPASAATNVRRIAIDEQYALRPDALDAAVREDRARGLLPCAVVATTGTTTSSALDPLEPIAAIARDARAVAARGRGAWPARP